jgi:type IV secretion system protein VirB9
MTLALVLVSASVRAQDVATNDAAFLEATLRRQWAGIDEELKLRKIDEEALGEANRWRSGEGAPSPTAGKDGRVMFVFGATVPKIICAPLRICDVELQAGESVHDVHTGDATRWDIQPALSGVTPHVVVKPMTSGVQTNIAVYTDRRVYHLELVASQSEHMPFVSFDYPEDRKARWQAMMVAQGPTSSAPTGSNDYEIQANPGALRFGYTVKKAGRWRVRRRIDWLPTRVYDDGEKTIIEMPRSVLARELPILLVRDGDGTDKIVNYRVKGPHFVVDRLFSRAVLVKGVGRKQERVEIVREED